MTRRAGARLVGRRMRRRRVVPRRARPVAGRPGVAHRGRRAHVAWLTGQTGVEPVDGPNHRGYPTIQLQKRAAGPCVAPCLVQFWAQLDDVHLQRGQWMSLATLMPDPSDRWSRVVTVNVGWEGWLHDDVAVFSVSR
jgi:hypothetical protein